MSLEKAVKLVEDELLDPMLRIKRVDVKKEDEEDAVDASDFTQGSRQPFVYPCDFLSPSACHEVEDQV